MAGAKEIRGKIASIKNTQKITKAMEMVAASKMRKAQDRMRAARPYAEKIRKIIGHLRQVNLDYKHPFTLERPVQVGRHQSSSAPTAACAVRSNLNLFKATLGAIREAQAQERQDLLVRHRLEGAAVLPAPAPAWKSPRRSRTGRQAARQAI